MSKHRGDHRGQRKATQKRRFYEPLEARTLLSAANVIMHPGDIVSQAVLPSGDIEGDTPAQIQKAYGFDQVTLPGGIGANGLGQTIAIVDPSTIQTVASDLTVFDTQFNIDAPPSLTVVNQTGGSVLPRTDGSWAGEIATDVEWAHAIAPSADILLVEAASDNTDDLMSAVDYARRQPGVSVMSLSWGGGEFPGETAYDSEFLTPAGHTPITVAAASGDDGAAGGPQWPGDSPNVLSVGGSVLSLQDTTGTYGGETSWTDSSGGVSVFEHEPSWQKVVQNTGMRTMPDVAYDADPNIGLALYDSVPYQGISGWQITNGTSVGTPQWGRLLAIADQARALNNQPALDGPGQTMPVLYGLYGTPGTAAYAAYASTFHDIITPEMRSAVRGRPDIGYDLTSGLGSPDALPIIDALTNAPPASSLTTTTLPLAPQVTISMVSQPPASAVAGSSGVLVLRLTNASRTVFSGSVAFSLFASTEVAVPTDATPIATLTLPHPVLGAHASRIVRLPFDYPAVSDATSDYFFVSAITSNVSLAPAATISSSPTSVAPAFVTLTPSFAGGKTVLVIPGRVANAAIFIKDLGNVMATGTLSLNLYESLDQTLDTSTDTLLTTTPATAIRIRPGLALLRNVRFTAPVALTGGTYYLIVSMTSSLDGQINTAVIGTRGLVR